MQKTTPKITWNNPADITYGTALSSTQLNAVASVAGTYKYTPASGTFLSAGTHTLHVDFTPIDNVNYNTASMNVSITVKSLPQLTSADFSASPTSGKVPLVVSFTDKSTGFPTSWLWDFGDKTTSNAQNPKHTYSVAGNYTVTLTAINTNGSTTDVKPNYITVVSASQKPVAAFAAIPTSGRSPLTVTFTDQSTNNPTSWSWNFGDGSTSSVKNPVHQYRGGKFTVTLNVSNAAGSSSLTKTNYIGSKFL